MFQPKVDPPLAKVSLTVVQVKAQEWLEVVPVGFLVGFLEGLAQ